MEYLTPHQQEGSNLRGAFDSEGGKMGTLILPQPLWITPPNMYDLGEFTTALRWRTDGHMMSSKTKASKPTTEASPQKKVTKKAAAKSASTDLPAEKKPKSRSTFPKITLRAAEFDVIAGLIRSRDPSRSAARLVLVDGMTMTQAAKSTFNDKGKPLSAQMVNNTIARIKAAHALLCEAYAPKG